MKGKYKILSIVACLALFAAQTSAGTCCYWVLHQPKMPERLKR